MRALDTLPPGHVIRHSSLLGLGDALETRYSLAHNARDMTGTLNAYREALESLPGGHPGRALAHFDLARLLLHESSPNVDFVRASATLGLVRKPRCQPRFSVLPRFLT